jgi:hypothetical protein
MKKNGKYAAVFVELIGFMSMIGFYGCVCRLSDFIMMVAACRIIWLINLNEVGDDIKRHHPTSESSNERHQLSSIICSTTKAIKKLFIPE